MKLPSPSAVREAIRAAREPEREPPAPEPAVDPPTGLHAVFFESPGSFDGVRLRDGAVLRGITPEQADRLSGWSPETVIVLDDAGLERLVTHLAFRDGRCVLIGYHLGSTPGPAPLVAGTCG